MVGRPLIRSRTKVNNIEVQDIMVGDEGRSTAFSARRTLVHRVRLSSSAESSANARNQLSGREWHREQLGGHEAYLQLSLRPEEDEHQRERGENPSHRSAVESREESRQNARSDARTIPIPRVLTRLPSHPHAVRAGNPDRRRRRHRRRCHARVSRDRRVLLAKFHRTVEHRRTRHHSVPDPFAAASRGT